MRQTDLKLQLLHSVKTSKSSKILSLFITGSNFPDFTFSTKNFAYKLKASIVLLNSSSDTQLPLFDEEAQKPIRKFLSSAFETEEDAQGRILLPKELVNFAQITKNIVFVGVGNRVEIWAEEVWDKESENAEAADFSVLAKFGV